ncbi:MAG: cell surface protein SprA, partial [Balneolaceae bacterium]
MSHIRRIIYFILVGLFFLTVKSQNLYAQDINEIRDSVEADTTYHGEFQRAFRSIYGQRVSKPFLETIPALYFISLNIETVRITQLYEENYFIEKVIGGYRSGAPAMYSFKDYVSVQKKDAIRSNWSQLLLESQQTDERRRGLLDFSITVPGGRQSAFTTIFGRPEVNLRVNGVAQMNVGASIQQSEDPSLPPDQQTRIDPTFDQNLQLNIQGTIGDKLTIQTDWDTERAFDYQNRLSIDYQGYEDEIIKSIEMGNVTMNTGNSLIRGSGALFGIKSVVELGSLRLTSILSQQDGESNVETISGGAQERPIRLRPADYSDDRFFFMDFYTRQRFETSMSNPQQLIQTLQIADVEVWILRENIQADEGSRLAVALAEMGVNQLPNGSYGPPDNRTDNFSEQLLDQFRDQQIGVSASDLGVEDSRNFEEGYFTLLQEGIDYTINKISGFISLRRPMGSREVLAVSYNYRGAGNETINVGELNRGGGNRIFLKMLRPKNVSTDNLLFPITMRNVYSLGVSGITRESLELELMFTEDNVANIRLPGRNTTLMQDLGLDRVDSQGALGSDNLIDFGTGTLDVQNGLLIFPYLEPFGRRVIDLLEDSPASADDINRLAYTELYSERQRNAAQSSKNSFYEFNGTSRGGSQDNFTLGIALVEGSVRVYANGVELQEDIDYQVDYTFGSISILNDRYTATGQDIRIEYEDQAFTSIEQRTFTGFRAEYELSNSFQLGGTYFRFNERPLDDKIRLGEEPISNSVVGFDANARFDAPFITRLLDAVPLIQTREASEFSFRGEFAQLTPGVSETRAVSRAIKNNELFPDEERGLSFIDDFESSNIKINLLNANRWFLASAPAAVPGYDPDKIIFEEDDFPGQPVANQQSRLDRSDLRSKFSWYSIPRNISTILEDVQFTPESEQVRVTDVFPGRETQNPQEEIITTLDVFYNPAERGQYNYHLDLKSLLENEAGRTWGGMTTVLPSGQEDFTQNSIEFLEFWVQPILPGGQLPAAASIADYEGQIFIDIGLISEDVVPNSKLNSEDGLALNPETLVLDNANNPRSAIPANPPPPEGQFSNENRDLEDVGLNGLPSSGGVNGFNEQKIFADFITRISELYGSGSDKFKRVQQDPSNDNYVFYGESKVQDLPLHERFHRLLGYTEGNTPLDQSDKRAITNRPDTEGLVNPSTVSLTNAYFQYEIEFNPADESRLEIGSPGSFIIDREPGVRQQDRWYQVRIPLSEFKRKIGDINDFQNITYVRIWMAGYKQPFTLRFATMEFVGSQWRQDENINQTSDPNAELRVSTINIEENSNRRPFPYRQPSGGIRAQNRGSQLQSLQNEQAIVLDIDNLSPGAVQLIKRVYPGGLDMLNYSNMRMFVHGEGYNNRGDAELVLRFGNDLENNYYEYRQPVTPSDRNFPFQSFDPGNTGQLTEEAEKVWLYEENSMNILLTVFNRLKQLRDHASVADNSDIYERSDILEDAVPGAVVAIKGNPSLGRVTEVGMGIRNPFDPDDPSGQGTPVLNAQFWLNE